MAERDESELAESSYDPDGDEREVLEALIDHGSAPLSVEELGRMVGGRIRAEDGLAAAERDGLVQRAGELYCLTRAAVRGRDLL